MIKKQGTVKNVLQITSCLITIVFFQLLDLISSAQTMLIHIAQLALAEVIY